MKDRKREYRGFHHCRLGTGAGLSPEAPRGGLEVYGADIPGRLPLCPVPAGGRGVPVGLQRGGDQAQGRVCADVPGLRLGVHPGLCGVQLFPQACVPDAGENGGNLLR